MLTVIAAVSFFFFYCIVSAAYFFPSVPYQPQFLPHFPFRSLFYLHISAVSGVREGGAEGGRDFLPQSAVLSAATCRILHSSSPVFPHSHPHPPAGLWSAHTPLSVWLRDVAVKATRSNMSVASVLPHNCSTLIKHPAVVEGNPSNETSMLTSI